MIAYFFSFTCMFHVSTEISQNCGSIANKIQTSNRQTNILIDDREKETLDLKPCSTRKHYYSVRQRQRQCQTKKVALLRFTLFTAPFIITHWTHGKGKKTIGESHRLNRIVVFILLGSTMNCKDHKSPFYIGICWVFVYKTL